MRVLPTVKRYISSDLELRVGAKIRALPSTKGVYSHTREGWEGIVTRIRLDDDNVPSEFTARTTMLPPGGWNLATNHEFEYLTPKYFEVIS